LNGGNAVSADFGMPNEITRANFRQSGTVKARDWKNSAIIL
jgi:hypothetical protein